MCADPVAWAALRPLPRVAAVNRSRKARTWQGQRDKYAALPKSPLVVTAELVTPVIHAERSRTHLDSILAFAALTCHPVASDYDEVAAIPLPVDLAWVSPTGQPLWVCTPLVPASEAYDVREYWHKRYPAHRAEFGQRMNAVTSAGRWKEYRVPVHAQQVQRLHAVCIGAAEEIQRLLDVVTHIGKKGSMGYGRVAKWTLTPVSHTRQEILAMRAVPVQCASLVGVVSSGAPAPNRGWTPPYWYAPWWSDCVVPDGW